MNILERIFGSMSKKEVKKYWPMVEQIEALAGKYAAMSEVELQGMTAVFKERLSKGESLDDILPDAFAVVREASGRVIGQRHYPVQLLAGLILHQGRIAEMRTGEGKTLMATLPAYLNALAGGGVHVVTVNDYLAKRDSEWMGKVYRYLGLSVGLIIHDIPLQTRQQMYNCDITYGTNNEFGFDYLRDNMATYEEELMQRGFAFGIVDEVDSILIDEARTPLIISGRAEAANKLYTICDKFATTLRALRVKETDDKEEQDDIDADYIIDEKGRHATLTPKGIARCEAQFGVDNITDSEHSELLHHINQAIRARGIMKRDIDYVVKDGQIIIVDEFTGRLMFGRRYSEGLHQAIEAKENVHIENESKTLATVTFQNFFRQYKKLSGMTGTAMTEEAEFRHIYKLDVIEIPTNLPMIRVDAGDVIYKNEVGKFKAVIENIKESHAKGQPVLVGTVSIEKSELLSSMLRKDGIKHTVLNAKNHEQEAEIVAQAGRLGGVTIATNMAGRGTDIMLGGNPEYMALREMRKKDLAPEIFREINGFSETDDGEIIAARKEYRGFYDKFKEETSAEAGKVRAAGGLVILGTERHESRRIDNQLRGRAGRQGDPGESRFYLSLEDDLMRLFGSERVMGAMNAMGLDEDTPIEQKMLTGAIERAQKNLEGRNFQTRKNVLQYDDVMDAQRKLIYAQRMKVLRGEDITDYFVNLRRESVESWTLGILPSDDIEVSQLQELQERFAAIGVPKEALQFTQEELYKYNRERLIEEIHGKVETMYAKKESDYGSDKMRELERYCLLRNVDEKWMNHIDAMHDLRQGIGLKAYAQTDPVVAYKHEGYDMLDAMVQAVKDDTFLNLMTVRIKTDEDLRREKVAKVEIATAADKSVKKQPARAGAKVGPNDPCPCGSGKKFKKCCRE